MQTLDFVSGLHNRLEFSQPLLCLYQAMQTRKTFSIASIYIYILYIDLGRIKRFTQTMDSQEEDPKDAVSPHEFIITEFNIM